MRISDDWRECFEQWKTGVLVIGALAIAGVLLAVFCAMIVGFPMGIIALAVEAFQSENQRSVFEESYWVPAFIVLVALLYAFIAPIFLAQVIERDSFKRVRARKET